MNDLIGVTGQKRLCQCIRVVRDRSALKGHEFEEHSRTELEACGYHSLIDLNLHIPEGVIATICYKNKIIDITPALGHYLHEYKVEQEVDVVCDIHTLIRIKVVSFEQDYRPSNPILPDSGDDVHVQPVLEVGEPEVFP